MKRAISVLLIVLMLTVSVPFATAAGGDPLGLSDTQLSAFKAKLKTALQSGQSFNVDEFEIPGTIEALDYISNELIHSDPENFHVSTVSCSVGSIMIEIIPEYTMTHDEYTARLVELRTARAKMVADLDHAGLTDIEKALILHDRLALAVTYSKTACEFEGDYSTAYGALVNGIAVCEGYTRAYSYLLSAVGIRSAYCPSLHMNHAWNIVYINNKAYHIDVTFDDPLGLDPDKVEHFNFLCSTDKFSELHHGGDYSTEPQDTAFDNAFWREYDQPFIHSGGALYNSDESKVIKYDNGKVTTLLDDLKYEYYGSGYHVSRTAQLVRYGKYVFYNDAQNIYRYDITTQKSEVALAAVTGDGYISGTYAKDGILYYDVSTLSESKQLSIELSLLVEANDRPADVVLDASMIFTDVVAGSWYNAAIDYTYSRGLFSGISKVRFGVEESVTRGMFVTVLARIAGVDTAGDANAVKTKFSDVASGRYFTAAIKWASENGVVNGMSATTFQPDSDISRQQLCVMIVNFAKNRAVNIEQKESVINFADSAQIAGWAKTAVTVCQSADIVNGYPEGDGFVFRPDGRATRAEAAQILYKFHKDFVEN